MSDKRCSICGAGIKDGRCLSCGQPGTVLTPEQIARECAEQLLPESSVSECTRVIEIAIREALAQQEATIQQLNQVLNTVTKERNENEITIQQLRAERRWIPVSERLPNEGDFVNIAFLNFKGKPTVSWAMFTDGIFDRGEDNDSFEPNELLGWQPLPAPPEGESK